ncbi:hypothetical protein [Halocalculus aciditolerans]|uniref:Uncharacterized protein n=1 Tax=Halocalculus aciditolerans TaxID=1383812 RepID=A0A830FI14_9EURY|nr:hypothetical protein [Halocalculus aciditolerans]GGL57944.1 hypothetical protein GCM10009039_15170 [Halocalculus aciditolerans]
MHVTPAPSTDDVPFNEPVTVTLDAGQQGTISFEPKQRSTQFVLPICAVTKQPNTTYEVRTDGENVYGPAGVPPTDIDDLAVTFVPARRFERSLKVVISNVSNSTHTYHVQPVGYEVA